MSQNFRPTWRDIERPTGKFETPDWGGGAHIDWMLDFGNSPEVRLKQVGPIPLFGDWHQGPDGRWWRETADKSLMEQLWHKGALSRADDGVWQTTHQDGFGGRTFTLESVIGLGPVRLRGPWFGGTRPGYSEMKSVDMTEDQPAYYQGRPWYKRMATFGYYISDDLLIRLLSRYCPDLPIAMVQKCGGEHERVEPYRHDWGCPKSIRHPGRATSDAEAACK
jgi:hypothetical protein